MHTLSSTLLAEQQKSSRTPYVKVEISNKTEGVVRLEWTRLYSGTEPDGGHAVALSGDGSLIRVRLEPDGAQKLYRQRVANPGTASDFSAWTDSGQYGVVAVACAVLNAEVNILWVRYSGEVYRLRSTDNGVIWGTPELIDYAPAASVYTIAAACKPNGDLALFFSADNFFYVKKLVSGTWQSRTAWDKTTGDLSGVACVYDGDWNLLVTGKDADGNFKLWSLVYGDGGDVTTGVWSDLRTLATATADSDFTYQSVFLSKPDACRCFFVEKFSVTESYQRPFWSHTVPGTKFVDGLWREPVPFDLSAEYGLALVCSDTAAWLSRPDGVWQAPLSEQVTDVTDNVLSVKEDLSPRDGSLVVELRNDDGRYAVPPAIGSQITFSPGYRTGAGNEVSDGQTFLLDACEYVSSGKQASLFCYASDGWQRLRNWRARHQFRWNQDAAEMSVKQMIEFVLARAGLKLEVQSSSTDITGLYPDFTIQPGNHGQEIIDHLLGFVPDVLLLEGDTAYLINPLGSDASVYAYGPAHTIFEGKYRRSGWGINRVQVTGEDGDGNVVAADSFAWSQLERVDDRLLQIEDLNLDTVAKCQARGAAYLRRAEMESVSGAIRIPTNCGQQLYDLIDITDSRAGLNADKKRVLGIKLAYDTRRGICEQQLLLGAP